MQLTFLTFTTFHVLQTFHFSSAMEHWRVWKIKNELGPYRHANRSDLTYPTDVVAKCFRGIPNELIFSITSSETLP